MFLAASAGGLDAYSYLLHGEVFAGLQTGNMILLGINIGEGDFTHIWRYVYGIGMFMLGVWVLRFVQHYYNDRFLSRQSFVINYEIVLLVSVMSVSSFLPNVVVLGILSMAAAAQLQEFRRLRGSAYTSLMMTGNLRTVSEGLYDGIFHKDKKARKKAIIFGSIILSFLIGTIVTGLLVPVLKNYSLIVSILFLVGSIIISHIETEQFRKQS